MKPKPTPAGIGWESVWDYPRPPRIEPSSRRALVKHGDLVIAESQNMVRVLETSLAPSYYLPREHIVLKHLRSSTQQTWCEWKGKATYFDLLVGDQVISNVAWSYDSPSPGFESIRGCLSFYPGLVDCFLDDEQVQPHAGGFYGGWISSDLVGPFKGETGSRGWQ